MAEAQLVVQEISGVTVANLSSASILDGAAVDAIAKKLFDLVETQARRKILLDFTRV